MNFISSYLLRNDNSKRKLASYIRQYVAVTGLGLEEFNKTLEGLSKVHTYFEDILQTKKFDPLDSFSVGENVSLSCYTRYFQARRYCRSAVKQPFGPGVDPNGDLYTLGGDSFVHTEENVVQYLGIKVNAEQKST